MARDTCRTPRTAVLLTAAGHVAHTDGYCCAVQREAAERQYLRLVKELLPERARQDSWTLRLDHCFGRVLLDHAVGRCWYDALDRRRVAYRQLDDAQLAEAVALGERLLEQGDPLLRELDAQSLLWRGKPQKAHLRPR